MALDPEFKAKWVAALRSGEYKQFRGGVCNAYNISRASAFCCIGVGAKVLGATSTETTNAAARLMGLSDFAGDRLVRMNDLEEKSFPEIADYIEANL